MIPTPARKACPKCGEPMFRDCNSDETIFFWSCTECDHSEKPTKTAREQAFDVLHELQKHPHTVKTR
jgi:uncharacterized Zn finger protein (UPF0148 family)